jgi:hypothetical protein
MRNFTAFIFLSAVLFFPISTFAGEISVPEFSHEAGTFTEPFELHISSKENAAIYYTLDGSLPDESSYLYEENEPVTISGSVMVRARTYQDGHPGEAVTKIYSQLHPNVADFDSDLPLVIVHQFDNIMHPEGAYRTPAYFTVIDKEEDGRARLLSNNLHLHSRMETNYRGTSSLSFPKKQFGVRLVDEDGENRNEPILGMPSENNWIMHAPWDDRTLIRNAVAYRISRDMGRYAPRTRFVELFLHDGSGPVTESHYHGVYMLVERIKWDNNRVNIQKLGPDDNSEPEITGGYIINHEYGRESHITSNHRNTQFALVRPQDHDITPQQRHWIQNYLGDLERALFGHNYRNPDNGYAAYLEPESFIDHHLITETFKEMDGYRLSTFLYKDRGGRLVMGPVWDYNLSLGNYITTEGWNGHDPTGWYYTHVPNAWYLNGWYNRLFTDPDFTNRYHERWWELRNGPFATEHFLHVIREYVEKLDEAKDRNFERWPILGEDVWHWSRDGFDTYQEEIDYMKNWITQRLDWIDTQMNPPGEPPQSDLLYFWMFDDTMVNNTPLSTIEADFAIGNTPKINFNSALEGYPFHDGHTQWRKASMERRNRPTDINYHPAGNLGRPYDSSSMRGLQVRQPFTGDAGENSLIFELPTPDTDEGLLFQFAAMDEGAADALIIDYSTGHDQTSWITDGLTDHMLSLSDEYQKYSISLGNIENVNKNDSFRLRIRFDGEDMAADDGNRVTFNNFSLQTTGESLPSSADEPFSEIAVSFEIKHIYPNPFNPKTNIVYTVPDQKHVNISVYNMIGQKVSTLVDNNVQPGTHQIRFDGSNLSSGVYFLRLHAGSYSDVQKLTLIK